MITESPTTFAMPSLGADMDEGRITEWLVHPGDHVARGQIIVIVETDKSDIEVEVFEDATVQEILVGEGEVVAVGTPIAVLHPDSPARMAAPAPRGVETPAAPAAPAPVPKPAPHAVTSPVLRHLADQLHVDTARLHGTGLGGRVRRTDVEGAARSTRFTPRARRLLRERGLDGSSFGDRDLVTGADVLAAPAPATVRAPTDRTDARQASMRRHIAELMARSWREIPHYHVAKRLDLSLPIERLAAVNEGRALPDRIVPGALLLCAAARAAAKVPQCNGWWHGGRFEAADHVHLGVVLSLRSGGIIVPTIERADALDPTEMMHRLAELVQRARDGRLRSSHLGESTITVTSLGDRGADSVIGIIHPPQVALVGLGAVHDEVWPVDGRPVIRPTVNATLAGDHRATDGLSGSRFLAAMQSLLGGELVAELEDS